MRYDVVVMGAGLSGLIAMARFAAAGFQVLGLEKSPKRAEPQDDLRSTAFLLPSITVLEKAEIWARLEGNATPLEVIEIVDARETPPRRVAFRASEIRAPQFGFNVMNVDIYSALLQAIETHPRITLRFGSEVRALMGFETHMALKVKTKSGLEPLEARLVIGADGRHSGLRALLNIPAKTEAIDQMAQVFTVAHEYPHHNVSTEVHLSGGPFTLVPRGAVDGRYASAVVWMDKTDAVKARALTDDESFEAALNARSCGIRGTLQKISPLGAFEMIYLQADAFSSHRAVLIGEAAHVVPPIGAQGLNMTLRDIESLVRVCERGALEMPNYLTQWARQREMDVTIRKNGIRTLNAVSIDEKHRAENWRRMGLDILEKQSPLRSGLMKLGLGV